MFHSRPLQEALTTAHSIESAVLEVSFSPVEDLLRAYDSLGPERIIFGSDYPVAAVYYRGIDVLTLYRRRLLELLAETERLEITVPFFHRNARRLFGGHQRNEP